MTKLTTRSGAPISRFAFGTMQFGEGADASASAEMFEACRAAGINHFDTANGYTDGASETLLGDLARSDRDNIYVATKIAHDSNASPANMAKQFDVSLARLGMSEVDLLYLHRFDDDTPLADSFAVLADWQKAGRIRHIGVSNYAAWQVMKAQAVCAGLGTRIDAIQPMFNLVKRQAEVELFPMCADQGITAFPYSPLGGGLLTGKYAAGDGGRLETNTMYKSRYGIEWMHETAADLARLATELGENPATLAVAWVAAHPDAPTPIISARNLAQLGPSLAALDYDMSPELWAQIAALGRTPAPATDRSETDE